MGKTLQQGNHKLGSADECRAAIEAAKADDPLTIERAGKLLRFVDAQGRLLGTLTARHSVAKQLDAGNSLLHCSVAWSYGETEAYPHGLVSARVVTGDPDDEYAKWCAREIWGKPRVPRAAQSYPVNIVGESFYQDAIGRCQEGDLVFLYREVDNPHDPLAIVAKTASGSTIGYIPRTNWLQRVVHEEGGGVTATIQSIHPGVSMAVVLAVTVADDELAVAHYQPPVAPGSQPATTKGWIARLFGN